MTKAEHDMTEVVDHKKDQRSSRRSLPPGGVKIDQAFRQLLNTKNYSDITIEEIVQASGVNSALIYKYYGDKLGLFFQVLNEGLDRFRAQLDRELAVTQGALNKLKKIAWLHINLFNEGRVPARLMLMEVRSYHRFFQSEPYNRIRRYNLQVRSIIREGVQEGVIRSDIPAKVIAQVFLGAIELLCLPWLVSGEEISVDDVAENLCKVFFTGIEPPRVHGKKDKERKSC